MALLGNHSVLHKSPGKFTTGTTAYNDRSNWNKNGMLRQWGAGPTMDWSKTALPYGYGNGGVWMLPKTAGAMVSRNVTEAVINGGSLVLSAGRGVTGNGTIVLSGTGQGVGVVFMTAAGVLVLSGTGSAVGAIASTGSSSFSLLGNSSALVGLLPGSGSSSLSLALGTANGTLALLGTGSTTLSLTGLATATAVVFISGNGAITLSGSANASAVLNGTGSSSFSLNGDVSSLLGILPGTGSASLSLALNAAVGELTLQGTGSASFVVNGVTSTAELVAQLSGNGTLTLNGLPSNIIASLLATGTGTMTINGGVAVPGGLGYMTGSSFLSVTGLAAGGGIGHMTGNTDTGALTAESIAEAVWNALTAAFTRAGSMGEALSSGGISPQTIRDAMTLGTTEIPEADSIDEKLDALQLSSLTAQEVRDSMALGTVAVPAAGSIDLKLNDVPSAAATAFMAKVVDAGYTVQEVLEFLASYVAADAVGLGSENVYYKSLDGSQVRLAGTVVNGVRTITIRNGT